MFNKVTLALAINEPHAQRCGGGLPAKAKGLSFRIVHFPAERRQILNAYLKTVKARFKGKPNFRACSIANSLNGIS